MRSLSTLVALCGALLHTLVHAQGPSTVTLGDLPITVGGQGLLFVDSSGTLTAEQAARAAGYSPTSTDVPNLLPFKGAYWLKLRISNDRPEAFDLSIPYADIDELDVYTIRDGAPTLLAHTGRTIPEAQRTGQAHAFDLHVPHLTDAPVDLLMRIRGFKTMHLPIIAARSGALIPFRADRDIYIGAFAGIMIVMALYNLFVFMSIRDKAYLYYVLYILAICSAQLSYLGKGPFDLFDYGGWLSARSSLLFSLCAIVLGMEFQRRFVGTRSFAPRLHKAYPFVYGVVALDMGLYLFGDPWVAFNLGNAICGFTALLVLATGIVSFRKGSRQAGFFLLAWSVFLFGVVVFVLKDAGVLAYNDFTAHVMPIGSAIEAVLLSFALADRINILRLDKERSQAEALQSAKENERLVRDQNALLEEKVVKRTHELKESLDHLKATQSQLVEAEKMSSLGQLTAGIAHEINNPINYIRSNIAPLKRDLSDVMEVLNAYRSKRPQTEVNALETRLGLDESIQEISGILHSMEDGANRTAEIVRGLRSFSRLDEGDLKVVDVNDGIRSTLSLLGAQTRDRISMELDLQAAEPVECLPGKLNQVFMNILNNAIQAVHKRHGDSGGRISVVSQQFQEHLIVTITDNGTGMDEKTRARVFEPFFTTKDVGEGTGLGLSIAHSIIEKHNGRIEVDSLPGHGTEFRLIIPNSQPIQNALRA